MSFLIYDLILLVLFCLAVGLFLYRKRAGLKRDGLMYLYRTQWGIKLIDWFGKKHANWLRPLQYVVITSGYALMVAILYGLVRLSYYYLTSPVIAKALKVPVVFPLIPYLPQIFKIDFLPPFYFTYWIIIIAIIAIPHEFAHGIFARLNNVRIKSTGFGFLGPFLAAFVEQDDKQMNSKSKFAQLSILAAGTFANVLCTILFGLILWLFFALCFVPAGVNFTGYVTSAVNVSDITSINGTLIDQFNYSSLGNSYSLLPLNAANKTYYTNEFVIKQARESNSSYLIAYDNSPAFRANLSGAIISFDGKKVDSFESLRTEILNHRPRDVVIVETISNKEIKQYEIRLDDRNDTAFLGVGVAPIERSGMLGWLFNAIYKVKNPLVYYESRLGDFGEFIYNLLWWIIIVSFSVALTNMLPLGPFDGGRYFMLTVAAITGSKKAGEVAFKWMTWFLLALVAALMVKWVFTLF